MIDGRRARQKRKADGSPRRRIELGQRLVSLGVRADQVTVVGMLIAAGTAVAVGSGHLVIGAALLTVGGLMDALDGAVAKASGSSSSRGAFFDSVADRVADAFLLGGVAWYLLSRSDPRLAILPMAILGVGSLISYERAKAESLGFDARGGLMERAERTVLLGAAILFHIVMVPLLVALLVLSLGTAAGRFLRVWRQASGVPVRAAGTWRSGTVESRWRAFRESGTYRSGRSDRAASRRTRHEDGPLSTRLRNALGAEVGASG
ncbi:MAG: phosphatidylinositol synthase, partial [Acidimicrobiaceae bacterium]|nr:phosphatidylinositol synthase [Acidimicrobiaceae bacterium]